MSEDTPRNPDVGDEELSAFVDGELVPEAAERIERALAASPELRARLAAFRAVDEGLRALDAPAPPASLETRLRERLASDARAPRRVVPARRRRGFLYAGAAAAAAAGLALWVALPRMEAGHGEGPVVMALDLEAGDLEVVELLEVLEALGDLPEEGERG